MQAPPLKVCVPGEHAISSHTGTSLARLHEVSLELGNTSSQLVPQLPQLSRSPRLSTHSLSHGSLPALQLVLHAPLLQTSLPPHACPHDPQSELDVCRSTQLVPHIWSAAAHRYI